MPPRPNWKGYLKLSLVSCPIALYPATSATEKVSFNQINKHTGNRVRYRKVDGVTGDDVEASDIIKGYEVDKNQYVTLEPEELDALQVESTHTIKIEKFVSASEVDQRYFDSPYYITPEDEVGAEAFAVIRDAMKAKKVVGIGTVVLSKRERPIILQPLGKGIHATTLRYPYEVRQEKTYFDEIDDLKLDKDSLTLAEKIIESKLAPFDPNEFVDHYENAVVDLLKKKQAGQKISRRAAPAGSAKVINLMDALRRSVKEGGKTKSPPLQPMMKTKTKTRVRA